MMSALVSMTLLPPGGAMAVEHAVSVPATVLEQATSATPDDVRLRVPSALSVGDRLTWMDQLGSIPVSVGVSSASDGAVRVGTDLWNGKGARFPAYTSSTTPPRAIVRVTHRASSGDPLAPGGRNFSFGIYFKKDARSAGTAVDNGDNLMQRGLASDPSQFKLQVDDGQPSCTVKGDRGRVVVRSSVSVDSRLWYRAWCSRTGGTVRLTVKEYRADGTTRTVENSRDGATGSLVWPRRQTPLSIGGKLAADGSVIRSATDQFNGWATNPVLDIDD